VNEKLILYTPVPLALQAVAGPAGGSGPVPLPFGHKKGGVAGKTNVIATRGFQALLQSSYFVTIL
jgi:hypothetical protein